MVTGSQKVEEEAERLGTREGKMHEIVMCVEVAFREALQARKH